MIHCSTLFVHTRLILHFLQFYYQRILSNTTDVNRHLLRKCRGILQVVCLRLLEKYLPVL